MTTEEYEQKKRKCWEEFLQKHEINTADGVTAGAFIMAFDRAYALGKHEKDAEGEDEMLHVSRKQIDLLQGEIFKAIMDAHDADDWQDAAHYILDVMPRSFATLFGSKCLPDEDAREDNFARFEPKPSEPKNKDCDNHLADVGKMMDRRLNIAAMAMQGILSNADRMKGYEYVATTPPCEELTVVVARNALRYADALIAEAELTDKLNK